MKATMKAIFTHYTIRNSWTNKDTGQVIPQKYELNFIDADTHEVKKFLVDDAPQWLDERKDNGFLLGDLELELGSDKFAKTQDAYRARFAQFTDRELVELTSV